MSSDLRLAKKVDFAGKVNFPTLGKKLLLDIMNPYRTFPTTQIMIIE